MTDLQTVLLDRIRAHVTARGEGPQTEDLVVGFAVQHTVGIRRALETLRLAGDLTCMEGRWTVRTPDVQLQFELGGTAPGAPRPLT